MSTQKRYQLLAGIMVGSLLASGVSAESVQLPDIVVTPTSFVSSKKEVGQTIRVITAEELSYTGASNLAEALALSLGTHFVDAGGTQSVFFRGLGSNHYQFLIDGILVADPSSPQGAPYLNAISLGDVERIEVLPGAQSVTYGSGAIGGVINVITKANRASTEGELSVRFGEGVSVGGINYSYHSNTGSSVYVSATQEMTDQYSAAFDGAENDEQFRDSYHVKLSQDLQVGAVSAAFIRTNFSQDYDTGALTDSSDRSATAFQESIQLGYGVDVGRTEVVVGYDQGYLNRATNAAGTITRFSAWHNTSQVRTRTRFQSHEIVLGATQRTELARSSSLTDDKTQHMTGYHAQWQWFLPAVSLRLGSRAENFSESADDTVFTYHGNVLVDVPLIDALIGAGVHSGHRQPLLFERFFTSSWGGAGNPSLKAERSITQEFSITKPFARQEFGITVYRTDAQDEIGFSNNTYVNSNGDTRSEGVEYSWMYRPKEVIKFMKLTYMHQESEFNAGIRRPDNQLTFVTGLDVGDRHQLGLSIVHVGEREDTNFSNNSTVDFSPYVLTNVKVQRNFNTMESGYIMVTNLGDVSYQPAYGYGAPGRIISAGYVRRF